MWKESKKIGKDNLIYKAGIETQRTNIWMPKIKWEGWNWKIGIDTIKDGKKSACSAGDLGSIPESRRSSREGNGYPLQYSCLEYSMDRGAWWATVSRGTKSQTQLSD